MKSQTSQIRSRRRHDAQFKAAVIAACREPGASVAAVAQAHGLNANLVRKWLVGRGLKRCGAQAPGAAISLPAPAPLAQSAPSMQFVPVQLPAPQAAQPPTTGEAGQAIEIELTRAGASLTVRWPAAQALACASWLLEVAAVLTR